MIALNLNTSFTDRVHDSSPVIMHRMPHSLSANNSLVQPNSFVPTYNLRSADVKDIKDDDIEPMEQRVARNIFRVGVLDEATKRALLSDSQSIGKFLFTGNAKDKDKEEIIKAQTCARMFLQMLQQNQVSSISMATITEYASIAAILFSQREHICNQLSQFIRDLTATEDELARAQADYDTQLIIVRDTEEEFYSVGKERAQAEEEAEDSQRDRETAEEVLESRQAELEQAQARVIIAGEDLARDSEGRVIHRDEDGNLFGLDENGERHEYGFINNYALFIRIKVRGEVTGDEFDRCQSGVCQIEDHVQDAEEELRIQSERAEIAQERLSELNARYEELQDFLDDLRADLYQQEEAIDTLELQRGELAAKITELHRQRDVLDTYMDEVFTNEDNLIALNNGEMSIQDLVDQMPTFIRNNYQDAINDPDSGLTEAAQNLDLNPTINPLVDNPFRFREPS